MNSNLNGASTDISRVVIATGNAHKFREFEQLLEGVFQLVSSSEYGVPSPDEDGLTFIENALIKARHTAEATGLPTLADDSGIVVPALDGAPGIYSARYAGTGSSDADNREKLLDALNGMQNRAAYFHATIVFVRSASDPDPLVGQGRWQGRIAHAAKGEQGFGYDPIFIDEHYGLHAAELSDMAKNRRSHRGLAIASLIDRWRAIKAP